MSTFKEMPDDSRVWIYQADRELSMDEVSRITKATEKFIEDWTAHGKKMKAAVQVRYNRFVILAADEAAAEASGCSIDKSVHFMKALEKEFGINLFDRIQIAYWKGSEIRTAPLDKLRQAIISDLGVDKLDKAVVFNNLVMTKGELKKMWEQKIEDSWIQSRI